MATKAEKLLDRAKAAAKTARDKRKHAKQTLARKAGCYATGYAIGKAEQSGAMERVPQLFGAPRTVVLGAAGTVAAMFVGGTIGDVLDGIGDGAMTVAAYQFGKGETVSGADEDELAQLEAQIDQAKHELGVSGAEEEVEFVEVEG